MKCNSIKVLIDSYIDDSLDARKVKSFETHIATCPECANELEYARRLRKKMESLPLEKAPDDFETRLFQKTGTPVISKRSQVLSVLTRKKFFIPLGAAAAIVMGLTVFLLPEYGLRQKFSAPSPVAEISPASSEAPKINGIVSAKKDESRSHAKSFGRITKEAKKDTRSRAQEVPHFETEIRLAYNDSGSVTNAEPSAQAMEEGIAADKAAESEIKVMKKEAPMSAAKSKARTSEFPPARKISDDFVSKIDSVIMSSGGTRIRLPGKTVDIMGAGGNKDRGRNTYNAKVIIPENEYDGLISRLSKLGTLDVPKNRPSAERGYIEFTLTVRRGSGDK